MERELFRYFYFILCLKVKCETLLIHFKLLQNNFNYETEATTFLWEEKQPNFWLKKIDKLTKTKIKQ